MPVQSEPILEELLATELSIFNDGLDLLVSQTKQHIFRFEVGVDDSANAVEEVQSHHDLSGDLLDQVQRETLVVIALEHLEQVDSEDLKDHAEVITVGTLVEERVEQVEDVGVIAFVVFLVGFVLLEGLNPFRMGSILCDFLQDLNLSCLPISLLSRRRPPGSAGSSSSPSTPHSFRT